MQFFQKKENKISEASFGLCYDSNIVPQIIIQKCKIKTLYENNLKPYDTSKNGLITVKILLTIFLS